ncbi:hypothetical protein MHYP_G00246250 [Metynnis hypsauchen]
MKMSYYTFRKKRVSPAGLRKARESNPGPSRCEVTVLPTVPPQQRTEKVGEELNTKAAERGQEPIMQATETA